MILYILYIYIIYTVYIYPEKSPPVSQKNIAISVFFASLLMSKRRSSRGRPISRLWNFCSRAILLGARHNRCGLEKNISGKHDAMFNQYLSLYIYIYSLSIIVYLSLSMIIYDYLSSSIIIYHYLYDYLSLSMIIYHYL